MTEHDIRGRLPMIVILAVFLLVPSFDTALKYFGVIGVAAYFLVGTVVLFATYRYFLPVFFSAVSEKAALYIAIALFIGLAALAIYMWPIANSGRVGSGSDADDALLIAANELASGRYPYYVTTYLGNKIGPMPGSILLSLPFSLTGTIQLQNVFWLVIFFVTVRHYEKSALAALALLALILILSPTVLQNIATGIDYVANSIFVMVFMWVLVRSAAADRSRLVFDGIASAGALGIALSSRSTFFLLMPLLLSVLVQNTGWNNAIKYLAISAGVFIAVTVPFWLYDPLGFAPLHIQGAKLTTVESVLPFAGIIVPLSGAVLAIILSFQRMNKDCSRFFLNCAIVQLFVLIFTATLYSLKLHRLDLYMEQSGYGMFTLFFGVTAAWMYILRKYPDSFVDAHEPGLTA